VFQACLNHGLARVQLLLSDHSQRCVQACKPASTDNQLLLQGSEHPLRLLPVALTTVEGEVGRAGLLRNQSLLTVLSKHTQCFRVMDKGNAGGPAVVPWLHDILIFPQ